MGKLGGNMQPSGVEVAGRQGPAAAVEVVVVVGMSAGTHAPLGKGASPRKGNGLRAKVRPRRHGLAVLPVVCLHRRRVLGHVLARLAAEGARGGRAEAHPAASGIQSAAPAPCGY